MNRDPIGKSPYYQDRNRKIYAEWLGGAAVRDLAYRHWLEVTTIKAIIAAMNEEEKCQQSSR